MSGVTGAKRPCRAALRARRGCGRVGVGFALAVWVGLAGCSPKTPTAGAPGAGGGAPAGAGARGGGRPAPVLVAEVMQKNMPRQVLTFGTGEAYATVAIKSLVGGQILRCHIVPGQAVQKDDLLYTIDARPFAATLKQLEAALARNRILAADALRQFEMAKDLRQKGIAAEDETRKAQAVSEALQAALLADQANIEKARLDVEYCTLRAPLSGRTGDLLVREGSVVKANDLAMVEIAQTMPLYVVFSVPQVYLPDVRKGLAAGSLAVAVSPRDADAPIAGGELTFIDNTVDVETGTIRLKATFPNQDERLWPGQFVSVVLTLAKEEPGIVIPAQAVQNGQAGTFVFVVRPDQTVEMRPLTVGRTQGDEAIISAGLSAGETVVTDGQVRLVPGAKVEVASREGKPAAAKADAGAAAASEAADAPKAADAAPEALNPKAPRP